MAQNIDLGSVTLQIDDAQKQLSSLSGAITRAGSAMDNVKLAEGLQRQVDGVKHVLSGLNTQITSMISNINSTLGTLDGSAITKSLTSIEQSIKRISDSLGDSFSTAIKDINSDAKALDFSSTIGQQRTLSNAFAMTSEEAKQQSKALKKTGEYSGDSFGLKGIINEIEKVNGAINTLQTNLQNLSTQEGFNLFNDLRTNIDYVKGGFDDLNTVVKEAPKAVSAFSEAVQGKAGSGSNALTQYVGEITKLSNSIKRLVTVPQVDETNIKTNLQTILDAVDEYDDQLAEIAESASSSFKQMTSAEGVEKLSKQILKLQGGISGKEEGKQKPAQIADVVNGLAPLKNISADITKAAKGISDAITSIGDSFKQQNLESVTGPRGSLQSIASSLVTVKDKLLGVKTEAKETVTAVTQETAKASQEAEKVAAAEEKVTTAKKKTKKVTEEAVQKTTASIDTKQLGQITGALSSINTAITNISTNGLKIDGFKDSIKGIAEEFVNANVAAGLFIRTINNGVAINTNVASTSGAFGKSFSGITQDIRDAQSSLESIMDNTSDMLDGKTKTGTVTGGTLPSITVDTQPAKTAITDLQSIITTVGTVAGGLKSSIESGLNSISFDSLKTKFDEVITKMTEVGTKFSGLVSSMSVPLTGTSFDALIVKLGEVVTKTGEIITKIEEVSTKLSTPQPAVSFDPLKTEVGTLNTSFETLKTTVGEIQALIATLSSSMSSMGITNVNSLISAGKGATSSAHTIEKQEVNQLYKEYEEYQQRYYTVSKQLQSLPDNTPPMTVTKAITELTELYNLMEKVKNGERDQSGAVISKGYLDYDATARDKARESRIERREEYNKLDLSRTTAEIKAANAETEKGIARVKAYYDEWERFTKEQGSYEKEQLKYKPTEDAFKTLQDEINKRVAKIASIRAELAKTENAPYLNADREREIANIKDEIDAEKELQKSRQRTDQARKTQAKTDRETASNKKKTDAQDAKELKSTMTEIESVYKRINDARVNMATGLQNTDEMDNEQQKILALRDQLSQQTARPLKGLNQDAIAQGQDKDYVNTLYERMQTILKLREKAQTDFEKTGDATQVNEQDTAFNNLYSTVQSCSEAYRDLAKEQDLAFQNSQITKTQKESSDAQTELIQNYGKLQSLYEKRAQSPLNGAERLEFEAAEKRIEQIKNEHKEFEKLEAVKKAAASAESARSYSEMALNTKNFANSYDELTKAIERYKTAKKSGDSAEQESAEVTISKYRSAVKEAEKYMSSQDKESDKYKQLAKNVGEMKKAIGELDQEQRKNANNSEKADNQSLDRLAQLAKTYIQMRGLRTLWKNATSYVTEYYDALNEIRVVTGKSEEESLTLGENYRKLAKEMSTTSQELAESAVTLYRQGLSDEQVNERLKYTTMYSKTSGLEMGTATELMTATINAYSSYVRSVEEAGEVTTKVGYNAEEVASMFTAVGNAAASSGEEIGTAAQKVASVAGEAGLSLEYLSAYIATLSEKTRLAPETIGTALNTMIARLRQIKQNGFNEEDETKINDVAKALRTIGVSLMDTEGNWRDLNEIFEDIGKKWDTMSDKQKSYISTTMAGTRQQNYFIALMNDLSKADEGASRAMELYNIAMNSSGSVAKSYATYMESATAAADRFKQAMENVYSSLLNANTVKGLHDIGTGLANGFAQATQSMSGFNVIIPVVAGGIAAQIAGFASLKKAMAGRTLIEWFTAGGTFGTKIGLVVAGVAAVIAIVSLLGAALNTKVPTMADKFDSLRESIDKTKQAIKDVTTAQQDMVKDNTSLKSQRDEYAELSTKANKTKEDNERLKAILDELSSLSPGVASALQGITDVYSYQEGVIDAVNKQLERNIELSKQAARSKIQEQLPELAKSSKKLKDLESDVNQQSGRVQSLNAQISTTSGFTAGNYGGNYLYTNAQNESLDPREIVQRYLLDQIHSGNFNSRASAMDFLKLYGISGADGKPLDLSLNKGFLQGDLNKNSSDKEQLAHFQSNEGWKSLIDQMVELISTETSNKQELEDSRQTLEATTRSQLEYYKEDTNLPDFLKQNLDDEVGKIIDNFNWEGDYEKEFAKASEEIAKQSSIMQKNYKEWEAASNTASIELEKAYNDFKANPTKDNQKAYNDLVDKYNDLYDGTLKKLGDDMVQTAEQATSAAETPKQETVQDLVKKQDEAMRAWSDGFQDQYKAFLGSKQEDGTYDLKSYQERLNTLRETNKSLYDKMIARMPQLEKVGTEITNTSDFTVADLMAYWNDMQGEWIKQYEEEIGRRSEQNERLAQDAKNAENELDPYLKLMAETAEDGNADAVFDLVSGFEENIRKKIVEYLSEQEFTPDSDKFAETVWDEEFMSKVTNSVEGWSTALKAAFSDATGETTKSAEETMYFLETLQTKLDDVNVDNFSKAFHELYDGAKSTDKKKMLEYLGITSEEANNITDDVVAKIKYNLDKKLLKLYEDTDDRTKKVLPGTSTLLDPKKAGTSEFQTQVETMRKGISTLHKALGQYAAIQDKTLVEGTEDWNDAVENLATYASVDQNLLKAGVGWDSVIIKLQEDTQLYANSLKAINEEIEKSKGQKVAKGQEEAWNKVAKAAGMTRDQLEQYGQSLFDPRSGIKFDRNKVSWQAMNAKGWDVEPGSYSTFDSFSTGVQLADGKVVTLTVTPILPNGKVLSEAEVNQYIEDNLQGLNSIDDIFNADNGENGKTIVMNAYEGGTQEIIKQAEAAEMAIHSLSDAYETMAADATFDPQSAFGEYGEGWWEGLERIAADSNDANQALAQQLITMAQIGQIDTSNIESVDDLMKGLGIYNKYGFGEEYKADGMFGSLTTLDSESPDIDKYEKKIVELSKSEKGLQQLGESWNRQSDTQQKSVKKMLGFSDEYYDALKKGTKDAQKWGKETEKAYQMKNLKNLEKSGKVLDGMSKIYDALNGNVDDATDATKKNITTLEKLNKGMTAYKTLSNGAKKGTTEYTNAMKDLTTATGMTEEQLSTASGMAQALSELTSQCDTAQFSLESLVNAMYAIAGSSFDPSTWNNGLITLGASASAAEKDLANMINTMLSAAGATISATLNADKTVASLHVNGIGSTGSKTTSNKKGGGGGGGGGGDKKKNSNTPSKDKKTFEQSNWLETIQFQEDQLQDLIDRLGIMRDRYDMQGYLTAEINTINLQNQKIREQTELYKQNMAAVGQRIEATKAELAAQAKGTEEYDKVLTRLKELQDAYAEYDTSILENENTLLENADAIKDLRRQILEQEIELRNVIKSAIEDRKQREEDASNAYIDMQDRVIEAIKARYEKERDEVERTTQLKIDALEEETNALSEALDERRALSDEQDKAVELAKLQAQYARIIADPTRAKEALEIQKKITDLQKEMAWDAAEKSVENQQKSIEKQVEDLEDYQERMNEYYDKLLEDNHNFADEATSVLGGSQEDIITWLKENDEEYKNSTAEQQAQMIKEWKDTLNTMSGVTETVWAEVEQIIAGGDEAIISFLEANSQEYMEASSYERRRMLEDWRDQLMYLHRAYENLSPDLALHEFTNTAQTWNGEASSNSSSGGGGGGGGSGNNKNTNNDVKKRTGKNNANDASNSGVVLKDNTLELDHKVIEKTTGRTSAEAAKIQELVKKKRIAEFDTGGSTGDQEGIAYIHRKERVLTPEQSETFDKVLKTMEALNRIYVSIPSLNPQMASGNTSNITFEGGIHIEVDQLSSDSDYEEVAERVMDYINERIGRGMSVGGVRIN